MPFSRISVVEITDGCPCYSYQTSRIQATQEQYKGKISFSMRKVHWVRFPSFAGKEVVACDNIYTCDYCYIINLIYTITNLGNGC